MVQYETYQSNAAEVPIMRRWVIGGLILSLGLHAGLLFLFYQHRMEGFAAPEARVEPPPIFSMKQVTIPEFQNTERVAITEQPQGTAAITVPEDKPEVSEIKIAPQIQEVPKEIFMEKPRVEASGKEKTNDAATRAEMDRELNKISTALLKDGPRMPRQPVLPLASGSGANAGKGDANVNIPGMANLNDLLEKTGALRAGDKAGMPGGALFEYDKYELRPEAIDQLRKLGTLIQKNPRATFSIEGHTDSFGSPDYNLKLSLARAEEVKRWLVVNFNVTPDRIQTKGFGSEKLIVPSDRSPEEQGPNRRVELVVKTNAGKR